MDFKWDSDTWNIIEQILKKNLVRHQIDSYNEFIDVQLENVITQFNPILLNYDYVSSQMFFKINSGSDISKLEYFKEYLNWSEIDNEEELYEKLLIPYKKYISEKTKIVELDKQLKKNIPRGRIKLKKFIDDNILIKRLDVDKHRYQLKINILNPRIAPASLHENNGRRKIMYPNEARLRNFTYSGELNVDIYTQVTINSGEKFNHVKTYPEKKISNINIGSIPILLNSKLCVLKNMNHKQKLELEECTFDEGGYFIINGSEKVIVSQERVADNKIYVFPLQKTCSKYSHICEIKSIKNNEILTPKNIQVKLLQKDNTIKISIPHIKIEIPITIMFKSLGILSSHDMTKYILLNDLCKKEYLQLLIPSLKQMPNINTQEEAKNYLSMHVTMMGYNRDLSEELKRNTYLNDIMVNDFLPHIENKTHKIYFLGLMVKTLLDVVLKKRKYDDRDSKYAFIGAGAVVTKEILPFALVVGNPSNQIGWVSEYGHRLEFDEKGFATCIESNQEYLLKNNIVTRL